MVLTIAGRTALVADEAAEEPLNRALLNQIGAERIGAAISVLTEMNDLISVSDDDVSADDENVAL